MEKKGLFMNNIIITLKYNVISNVRIIPNPRTPTRCPGTVARSETSPGDKHRGEDDNFDRGTAPSIARSDRDISCGDNELFSFSSAQLTKKLQLILFIYSPFEIRVVAIAVRA